MFIDGIKAVLSESSETKLWRFRSDTGARRHLCAVCATAKEQDTIRASLRWALFAVRDKRLKAAMVHLTDSNGETWIFDRQGDQFRCFRNRQLFDGRWDVCLKELFKDYLPPGPSESPVMTQWLREFELRFDGARLMAIPQQWTGVMPSHWEKVGLERVAENRRILDGFCGAQKLIQGQDLSQLLDFGDGISARLRALQHQSRDVDKIFQQLGRIDGQLPRRLEQEVELLTKIEAISTPLTDPAKNPRILQERLREVEKELQEICERWGIKSLPAVGPDHDWAYVLQLLTRYLACDRLEKAARKSLHDARTSFKPIYDDYRKSIRTFLQNDKELIRELEGCLQELGAHVRVAVSEQAKNRENLSVKLNKLLGLSHLDSGAKGEGTGMGPHSLAQARATVNQCLQHMAKLYSDLDQNKGSHDNKFEELEERYNKILVEFGKSRDQWLHLAKEMGLPVDIGVKGLLDCINQYSKVYGLHQRRVKIQTELDDYRTQIKTLVLLLTDWRTYTGSQKPGSPEPSLALNEARSVLLYAEKKRDQLLKIRSLDSKLEAYQGMKAKIDRDLEGTQKKWHQALQHWSLPHNDLVVEAWEPISRVGRELLMLEQLFVDTQRPILDGQVFGPEAMEVPVVLYACKEGLLENKARLHLLQQVERADDGGFGLILTEDQTLFEMLCKLGLSHAQRVEEKIEGAAASPAPKGTKPIISDRARAALEIFANKQGGPSRSNV